ncbi:WhiB family transcriptional regulator [Nonomuraea sp. NPDC050556]|uniref:WhiB family transcriptional regulator n=1 Tax=Nonomuraea sp. NPDC050556 TaxID=3364369 RepID=UPI0037A74FAA
MNWMERGACRDSDPELFFPLTWETHPTLARRICRDCPVRVQCLTWAVDTGEPDEVWGGTTPAERRRIRSG